MPVSGAYVKKKYFYNLNALLSTKSYLKKNGIMNLLNKNLAYGNALKPNSISFCYTIEKTFQFGGSDKKRVTFI